MPAQHASAAALASASWIIKTGTEAGRARAFTTGGSACHDTPCIRAIQVLDRPRVAPRPRGPLPQEPVHGRNVA